MIFLNLKYILRYRKIIFYSVLFFFSVHFVFGQSIASTRKAITAEFSFDNVEFRDLAFITNVLKVRNNNGKTYTFSINLNIPMGWKSLVDENKEYTLKPNDSVFVPVRFVTNSKKVKGGTKYSIAAYVNTNEIGRAHV